jgi:hypothetical protein
MTRSRLLATALAVGFVAAGTLGYLGVRVKPWQRRVAALDTPVTATGAKQPRNPAPADETPFQAPPEPTPPEPGTPAHAPYFQAMVAGDEHALQLARSGLAAAQGGSDPASPAHVRRLQEMERFYTERLARHRLALDESNHAR